jgi:hypothetical protein
VLCGVAVLVLLAAGCERNSQPPPPVLTEQDLAALNEANEPAPDAAPDLPAARTDAAFDAAYSGEAERPELPEDVPTYTPATPISSMSSATRGTIVYVGRWSNLGISSGAISDRGWTSRESEERRGSGLCGGGAHLQSGGGRTGERPGVLCGR